MPDFSFTDAPSLLSQVLALSYFSPQNGDPPAIPVFRRDGSCPLVLIVGENASGKSFFRRLIKGACSYHPRDIECIDISMEGRGRSYGGIRGLIYGDEESESTGVNSSNTVTVGIRTCRARSSPHVIFWDEPDLGLSENASAGLGQAIASYMAAPNTHTLAACVVTHSKPLVRELVSLDPHYLYVGDGEAPPTLQAWLELPLIPRSPDDIQEAGRRRFRAIQKILDAKNKF